MPTITLKLKTPQAEANLQADDISEANVEHIIRGVFAVFGSPLLFPGPKISIVSRHSHEEALPEEEEDQAKLMDEMEKEPDPEFWKTGIKYKRIDGEDVPHYCTKYRCPNPKCKKTSKHYVREGAAYTECHNCTTKIAIKKATMRGIPDRDAQGNFYVADAYYVEPK